MADDAAAPGVMEVDFAVPVAGVASFSPSQCLTWSRVAVSSSVVPGARSGSASIVVRNKLYVFGGYGGGTGRLDDFYSFDFTTGAWEEVAVLSDTRPSCRENNGAILSDSSRYIYMFGGYNGSVWMNDLWKFDIETKLWTCIQETYPPLPPADEEDDEMNAAMGDPPAVRQRVPGTPSSRFGFIAAVHKGKLIVSGGFDGSVWMNDMHSFCLDTKTWTEIRAKGQIPSARSCPAWSKNDTHLWIHGGYDGVDRKADFYQFDLNTLTWTELPCLGALPSPRYFHSCASYGSKLYIYGGYSGKERLDDMYAYDFETHHWALVNATLGDKPSGRSSLVAQVYENFLYIFGGYNGSNVLNDFYKFRLQPIGVPPPSLVSDFAKLINNSDLSDVCFLVEGKYVYAHRAVLAIRSECYAVWWHAGDCCK
jgi:leucine-zipper-like transcriptional regulator 1